MASPIQFFVNVNCGLRVSIEMEQNQESFDWRHKFDQDFRSEAMTYIIAYSHLEKHLNVDGLASKDELFFEGIMSPTNPLTLSQDAKKSSGIPLEARRYAYIHPPMDLALKLKPATTKKEKILASFSLLGAFIYLDDTNDVLCVNALTHSKAPHKFSFKGPYEATTDATKELQALGRACPTSLGSLQEAGFVASAWVLPNETFRGQHVGGEHKSTHGAIVYFRDDNRPGVVYLLSKNPHIEPSGILESISEAYDTSSDDPTQDASVVCRAINRENIYEWRRGIVSAMEFDTVNVEALKQVLEDDGKTIIHKACRAETNDSLVISLINTPELKHYLYHKDEHSWTALHYACYFCSDRIAMIEHIIRAWPSAVIEPDEYGRYPLHLALQSNGSSEVIKSLLDADESKITVHKSTKYLGRLPIHIACDRHASVDVLQLLLEVDTSTVHKRSAVGHLPLHLAILNKASYQFVKVLIDADTAEDFRMSTIFQVSNGMIPLHIACWNDSSDDIISLLLDKDCERVHYGTTRSQSYTTIDIIVRNSNFAFEKMMGGMVALHIATKYGSSEVVKLLLEQEVLAQRDAEKGTVCMRDDKNKCPLHVACENNASHKMIHLLLHCDPNNCTINADDNLGFNPIHRLACNEDASIPTMKILLEAANKGKKNSAKSPNQRNRTPLCLAVENGMSVAGIQMLLHPDHFTLEGLSPKNQTKLAGLIATNGSLQGEVLKTLSRRSYVALLLMQFGMNVFAVIAYIIFEKLRDLMYIYIVFFAMRVFIQIASTNVLTYLFDFWSLFEVILLILLTLSLLRVDSHENVDEVRRDADRSGMMNTSGGLIVASGFFLIMDFISSLRATFYPIARLLTGLVGIIFTLIPFFIVLILVLLGFANAERELYNGSFKQSFLDFFLFFISEPDKMIDGFDIMFGLLLNLIMLNVVIAIVCNAWDKSDKSAPSLFWRFRLVYIDETSCLDGISYPFNNIVFNSLFNYIDGIAVVRFWDHIEWSAPPYNVVETEEEYKNPSKYFDSGVVAKVVAAHSLGADLYWMAKDARNKKNSFYYDASFAILGYIVLIIQYVILFVLGLVTFGMLWPLSFRLKFLTLWIPNPITKSENESEVKSVRVVRESRRVGKSYSAGKLTQALSRKGLGNHSYSDMSNGFNDSSQLPGTPSDRGIIRTPPPRQLTDENVHMKNSVSFV